MLFYDKKWKQHLLTALLVLAGNLLLAFLVAAFVIPHNIIMGGTTGIGIMLSKIFPSWDVSLFVLILNVVLLILGLFLLGKKFFFSTVASSILYPAFLAMFQRIPGIENLTQNSLLAAVFAGFLLGVALGLVMRVGSSTGGIDVLVLIINKFLHIPLAPLVWLCDFIIIGGQAFFEVPEKTLLGILMLVLESIILDKTVIVGKAQMQIFAISQKHEDIRAKLLHELQVGVTMIEIETGLLGEKQHGVLCVVPQRKLYQAAEMIRSVDKESFITISKINEVRGRGFTEARQVISVDRNNQER